MVDLRNLWHEALDFESFVAQSTQHQGLWRGIYRLARLPQWVIECGTDGCTRRLLVIAEDWCGDASNTIPILARWAEATEGVDLRIVKRDENPELMDRYLTNGSRSIPIVIVLDEDYQEVGHWGPRPTELQAWVMANKDLIPKEELYPQVRRWYARDRGQTTIKEVMETAGVALTSAE